MRIDLAHGRTDSALRQLELAASLVAARHQDVNPDAYDIEILRAQTSMPAGDYVNAAKHATSAAGFARAGAIDETSSAWVGEALLGRAQAEKALGQSTAAAADARAALSQLEPNLLPTHALVIAARGIAAAHDGG